MGKRGVDSGDKHVGETGMIRRSLFGSCKPLLLVHMNSIPYGGCVWELGKMTSHIDTICSASANGGLCLVMFLGDGGYCCCFEVGGRIGGK